MRTNKILAALAAAGMALLGIACDDDNPSTPGTDVCPFPVAGVEKVSLELDNSDVTIDLVHVDTGFFYMGESDTLVSRPNERPAHLVNIKKDFYISATVITQRQFWTVLDSTENIVPEYADYPMTDITIEKASLFCVKLKEMRRQNVSLPTEAQWEYAARGGHVAPDPQTLYAGSDDIEKVAWYYGNSWVEFVQNGLMTQERRVHPVAQKWPNALGLYDMTGNVWEMTSSGYGLYTDAEQDDPTGDNESTTYVVRGSCWTNNASRCRLTVRSDVDFDYHSPQLGFRIVLTL